MNNCDNSISLIRLIAAFQVLFFHLVAHLQISIHPLIDSIATYFRGVPIFFILSGFLIWFSIERSSSSKQYICKRFWRIYPELWCAVVIEIISILVLYRKWNAIHLGLFALTQGTILQFWTPSSLREYGCGTPNGALWTICVMIQFYLIAWLIHKVMKGRKVYIWILAFAGLLIVSILGKIAFDKVGIEILSKLYGQTIFRYCWLFFIGCFIANYKDKILPVLSRFWYLFLLAGIVPYITGFDLFAGYYVLWSILLVCGLIGFAFRFPKLAVKHDISYGIFLYHMIVINAFIALGLVGNWLYALFAVLLSVLLAWLSYITIGKWSANRKNRIAKA